MEDLRECIEDARYIGAVTDPTPRPARRLLLPSEEDAELVVEHERRRNPDAFSFNYVIQQPLGYFFVRVTRVAPNF